MKDGHRILDGARRGPRVLIQAILAATALTIAACATRANSPEAQSGLTGEAGAAGSSSTAPSWLRELNRLRATGGLKPVREDPELSRDCVDHARYLVEQGPAGNAAFGSYERVLGLGAHHEDPQSAHYSAAGDECAEGRGIKPGFAESGDISWNRDAISDLDGLFYDAPFHRFSMLAAWATMAGYGDYGDFPRRAGALAFRGRGGLGSPLIRFPAPDSVVPVGAVNLFEIPNPLASCPGYRLPVGLPITIQVGSGYRGGMVSYRLQGPSGLTEACGFDWSSYQNPDATERVAARRGMKMFGGMIIIPRQPLADGRYEITVVTSRQTFNWSFTVTKPVSPIAADQP